MAVSGSPFLSENARDQECEKRTELAAIMRRRLKLLLRPSKAWAIVIDIKRLSPSTQTGIGSAAAILLRTVNAVGR
jgi:hypothetical protein